MSCLVRLNDSFYGRPYNMHKQLDVIEIMYGYVTHSACFCVKCSPIHKVADRGEQNIR